MIRPQFTLDLSSELIVDNFAGGGGASTGIELALGRHVDMSWNHDPEAVAMHQANHPQTQHFCQDVFDADPVKVCAGRPVGLAWFSPDCTHFSKARGKKPRKKNIRGLAWVVVKWAATVRPRVIILENVEEFQTWGPLLKNGQPCARRAGKTFQHWLARLRNLGYAIEWRELRACDYGAPTIRKRLFIVARCDGKPIVWPEATHGDPKRKEFKGSGLKPWRTAAECIDWTLPCPSIFERARPLAEATCRRIAKGIMRYVVNCADPFIVPLTHHDRSDRVTTMTDPVPTVTSAHRGEQALVMPTVYTKDRPITNRSKLREPGEPLPTVTGHERVAVLAPILTEHANASRQSCNKVDEPLRTQCANVKRGHFAVVAPILAETAHGEQAPGGSKRYGSGAQTTKKPINTISGSNNAALVTAFLAQHNNHQGTIPSSGRNPDDPMSTVTAKGCQQGLVTGCLVPRYGEREGQEPRALDLQKPSPTVVPDGNGGSLVAAHLTKFRTGSTGSHPAEPLHTITAGPKENPAGAPHAMGVVTAHVEKMHGTSTGHAAAEPLHTVGAQGNHFAEVRAFLIKYYGSDQDPRLEEPLHTVTARDRFGLVTVNGEEYAIADIGLRMLAPAELFRAQGFPTGYIIDRGMFEILDDTGQPTGRREIRPLTKSAQVRMCGNSVCPPMAAALVRANVPELQAWSADERKRRTG